MNHKLLASMLCAFTAFSLSAQVEILPDEMQKEQLNAFKDFQQKNTPLKAHLTRLNGKPDKAKINAARVAADFEKIKVQYPVLHYSVPAMSETQYLPDVYPFDGEANKGIRIISAQNEYEPGSFLVYPLENFGKAQFEVSDLRSKDGTVFPKSELDLKTVKVWYQNGNGWYSYFQDNGFKLTPELLLNDEDLIKVDTQKVANFARLTGKNGKISYYWLTAPRKVDNRLEDAGAYWIGESFYCMKPEFQDAPVFKGATLNEGEFKQFFLTAHVKDGQKPGIYNGNILIKKNGRTIDQIPVTLRVLPFSLPKPKTYFDLNKDFLMFMCEYISLNKLRQLNGNDPALAEKQMVSLLKDFVRHNETMPNFGENYSRVDLAKEAGCDISTFVTTFMSAHNAADRDFAIRRQVERHIRKFGKIDGYYGTWGDEFGLSTLRQIRPMVEAYQKAGFRFTVNSRAGYQFGGYLADLFWPPMYPDHTTQRVANKYHFQNTDGYFGWYATQHVGVENPAFIRRQYGLGPYRAGLSCHFNYAHHLDGYNDQRGDTYKSMCLVYGSGSGVIDTIAWEGFREGMDDIRYATLLQQLARPLEKSKDLYARYAAKKALHFLAEMDTDDFDLTTARLEMIRHILTLQKFSK